MSARIVPTRKSSDVSRSRVCCLAASKPTGWFHRTVGCIARRNTTRRRIGRYALEPLEARTLLAANVVINELHYDPDVKVEPVEFVELYNAGDEAADLSAWTLSDAVSYRFAQGTTLRAGGYLVISQNPDAVAEKFGVASLGPFQGKLSNESDRVVLSDGRGEVRDEVTYRLGFPWPTVGDAPGNSIELANPELDNDLGGSWRSSSDGPTPGAVNSQFTDNVPPQMRQVQHDPEQPKSGEDVRVTVKVTDTDGVSSVSLDYQIVAPGDYISIDDPRYATEWTTVAMRDDGQSGDADAGDDVYTVRLPGSLQQHRYLVRYRITATDGQGNSATGPYDDDPVPNFAYYIYDGIPDWAASVQPGVEPEVTFTSEAFDDVQTYQLITTRQSHADAQQLPDARIPPYEHREYLWHGALVVDGEVYDHVRYRARGGVNRFARGKNSWKFDFNRGHELKARDNYGERYKTTWDKLNLSHIVQQERGFRGDHGMSEAVSFRLFNLGGIEGPNTHYLQLRIVEQAEESPADQYSSDFQGLYLAVEQPDGRMLDEHGLPDGNLYKIEQDGALPGSLNNQGPTQPSDSSDLVDFVATYSDRRNRPNEQWWRDNVDLQRYFSYRSIVESVRHYDITATNQFYFHNPETDKWSVHPWDLDLTWRSFNVFGNGADAFSQLMLRNEGIALEYRNRQREILDLLFNHDQTDMLIDELARFIYTPGQQSIIDAERAMWDYNPVLGAARAGVVGQFYENSPTGDFAGMIQIMKQFIDSRSDFISTRILTDEGQIPATPEITYVGDSAFPVNRLTFQTSAFQSPADSEFAGIEWRLAEVTDITRVDFDPSQPRTYEIEGTWESGQLTTFADSITVPSDDLHEGLTYRARVRMLDADGRWSHWSSPVQFVAGPGKGSLVEGLRITELNYHPYDPDSNSTFDSNDFEFIELQNVGNETIDLVGVNFQDGIEYTFVGKASTALDATFDNDEAGFGFEAGAFTTSANSDYEHGSYDTAGPGGGALRIQLGPGVDVEPAALVEASFDSGLDGFRFVPDAFDNTNNPDAVSASSENGLVKVTLGPGDTGGPSSGAWTRTFSLAHANTVDVSATFGMAIGPGFESTEFGEVVLEIDGVRYGNDLEGGLARLAGKGTTSIDTMTTNLRVALGAGDHTIAVGAFNNQATDADEFVEVTFDEVSVTLTEPGATGPTSGAWTKTINLPAKGTLQIALDYRLVLGEGFEPSESGEIILTVDGVRYGPDVDDSLFHWRGGESPADSGWVTAYVSVPLLDQGDHELVLGTYNSGATASDEFVDLYFDNVQVTLFDQILVAPGDSVLVVANRDAFRSRYGDAHTVVGQYDSGRLSNGGERLVVKTPINETIQDFVYDDQGDWPREADGRGSSLEVIDTAGDYNDAANWRASPRRGGSPAPAVSPAPYVDFDHDGRITGFDFLLWQSGFARNAGSARQEDGDANGDGHVDTIDLTLWNAAFSAANAADVGEPIALLAAGARDGRAPEGSAHAEATRRTVQMAIIALLQDWGV